MNVVENYPGAEAGGSLRLARTGASVTVVTLLHRGSQETESVFKVEDLYFETVGEAPEEKAGNVDAGNIH